MLILILSFKFIKIVSIIYNINIITLFIFTKSIIPIFLKK